MKTSTFSVALTSKKEIFFDNYSYKMTCLISEDSSDPSDLGLDVEEYSTAIVNNNRGHQRSQSPVETPGGGRKCRENERELIMAMQQLEKERYLFYLFIVFFFVCFFFW